MKFFDQLEVIPVYQTTIMMMWILTGMIVFDEIGFYSTKELVLIFGSMVLCCIGIYFLYSKTKFIKQAQGKTGAESGSSGYRNIVPQSSLVSTASRDLDDGYMLESRSQVMQKSTTSVTR